MVTKYFLCSFLILGTYCFAQNKVIKVDYDFYLNLGLESHYNSKLFLSPTETLFLWGKPNATGKEEEGNDFTIDLRVMDSIGSYNYTTRSVDSMYSRVPQLDHKSFIVKELIPPISWTIGDQAKKIGPYNCQKAVGTFRGREYTVWFTYDIPISSGPWKLQGLPGLIISASDGLGQIKFLFKSITKSNEKIEPDIKEGTIISINEFAEIQSNISAELLKKMKSKLPRGTTIEMNSQNAMEIFEIKK